MENDGSSDSDFEASSTSKTIKKTKKTSLSKSSLSIGDSFASVDAVVERVQRYGEEVYSPYYRRDAMTIAQARKKSIVKPMKDELKYYTLKFCCINGGKNFKSRSTGVRQASTFQNDCPAFIRFTMNEDGTRLVVTGLNERHNHICSNQLYQHLPQVRALCADDKTKVSALLELGANRKQVKQKISAETNKMVLFKDLSNIMARKGCQNNLQSTIDKLREKYKVKTNQRIVPSVSIGIRDSANTYTTDVYRMSTRSDVFSIDVDVQESHRISVCTPLYNNWAIYCDVYVDVLSHLLKSGNKRSAFLAIQRQWQQQQRHRHRHRLAAAAPAPASSSGTGTG